MEPADARTHFGANGSTEPSQNSTAPTPDASAIRRSVPAFPGSATAHRTSTAMPAACSSASSSVTDCIGASATTPLRRHHVGELMDRARLHDMHADARGRRVVDDRLVGARFDVDRFDRHVHADRLRDEHGTVDDVATFLLANGAAARQRS